ncbi:MAG: hypothetical protein GQ574_03415 [Crocinitomix sp.]|nr:hypothetical protein [Crocinitomix sp.]
MDLIIIGLSIGLGLPFFLLYSRKKTWFKETYIYVLNALLCVIGLILAFAEQSQEFYLLAWCLMCPIVVFLFDRIFKKYSEKKNGRDFILWLRYSDEINWSVAAKNPHVMVLDKIISVTLLTVLIGLVSAGAVIFGK